jgi:ribonuclease HII
MILVGIDEVGRGCWAGPVVAGAVILLDDIDGLRDSKQLSTRQRGHLATQIHNKARAVGLGWVANDVVDAIGLTAAVRLAMERALQSIIIPFDTVIIDGNYNFLAHLTEYKTKPLVRADATIPVVSAASIVAKVARDAYMVDQARLYPEYGFEQHVGYGTKRHHEALQHYGPCKIHRRSYKPVLATIVTAV